MGPQQVAAVHRVQGHAVEPAAQGGQLPVALGRDGAVILAVGHPEQVALRLGVADQVNSGHNGTSFL